MDTTTLEAFLARLRTVAADRCTDAEPAHDILHVLRVTANARTIATREGADPAVVLPAALLHELFNHPKGHPESHLSGDICAQHARAVLNDLGYPGTLTDAVCDSIQVHSFSRGIFPTTLEARVLQDADRLDAIGAIGIARCFATCAAMGRPLYNPTDPFCEHRAPEDKLWGVDHFYRKLLKIQDGLHTATARALAADRTRVMVAYLHQLTAELSPDADSLPTVGSPDP